MVIQVSLDVLCLQQNGGEPEGGRAWLPKGMGCGGPFPKVAERKKDGKRDGCTGSQGAAGAVLPNTRQKLFSDSG